MGVPVSDLSTAMSGTQSARTSECNLHCVLCCLPFPSKCVPNRFLPPPFIPELQSPFVATYIDVCTHQFLDVAPESQFLICHELFLVKQLLSDVLSGAVLPISQCLLAGLLRQTPLFCNRSSRGGNHPMSHFKEQSHSAPVRLVQMLGQQVQHLASFNLTFSKYCGAATHVFLFLNF
jgi:hypothetical protein